MRVIETTLAGVRAPRGRRCFATIAACSSKPGVPTDLPRAGIPTSSSRTTTHDRVRGNAARAALAVAEAAGKAGTRGERIDLRRAWWTSGAASPTFGRWLGFEMSADRFTQLARAGRLRARLLRDQRCRGRRIQVHWGLRPARRSRHDLERPRRRRGLADQGADWYRPRMPHYGRPVARPSPIVL